MPDNDPRGLVELLTVGPMGGIDPTTDPLYVAPTNFVSSSNFVPNANYGGFKLVKGRINALFGLLPSAPNGMFCFQRQGQPDVYIFACDFTPSVTPADPHPVETCGLFYAQLGTAPTRLTLPTPLSSGQKTKFVASSQWCFVTNGKDTPLKIDADLNVTRWGIIAPSTASTVESAGPGVLVGTYYYCTTFSNDTQESSQGAISDPITFTSVYASAQFRIGGNPSNGNVLYLTAGALGAGQATTSYKVQADSTGNVPSIFEIASDFAASITADAITSQYVLAQASVPNTDDITQATITLTATTPGADGNFTFFFLDKSPSAGISINHTTETLLSGGQDGGTAVISALPQSTDAQVTDVNIYRLGGSLGTWNLIATLPINTAQTYYDFTHDDDVTGQQLVVNRDPPPPFNYICVHQERIFGFGIGADYNPSATYSITADPSVAWWSNLNEPWGFNAADNTFTCGDNKLGDVAMGMMELGGVLAMMKSKRVYWVYGSTDTDFQPIFAFYIGCDAPLSLAVGYGMGFWHSRQGVHYTDGSWYYNISDGSFEKSNVKAILDSLDATDFEASVGFIYDRQYYLSFPTQGFSLCYDLRVQAWYPIGLSTPLATYDLDSDVPVVTAGDSVNNRQAVQWFATTTDLGSNIVGSIKSRVTDGGAGHVRKQLRYGILEAPVQPGVIANIVTECNPSSLSQLSDAVTLNLGYGVTAQRWSMSVPTGTQVQTTLTVTSAVGATIQKLSIYGWIKSMFSPGDEEPPAAEALAPTGLPVLIMDTVTTVLDASVMA